MRPKRMSRVVMHCIVILSLFGICAAQNLHPCSFSSTSDVGHVEGITVQQLTVIERAKRSEQQSSFLTETNRCLVSFSRTRPSAPLITIQTYVVLQWGSNDDSIRPREFQFCAKRWLLQHVNLDLNRLANAGNSSHGWIPDELGYCGLEISGKVPSWPGGVWLDFGQERPVPGASSEPGEGPSSCHRSPDGISAAKLSAS